MDLAVSTEPPPRYGVEEIVAQGKRVQRRRRARGWAASGTAALAVLGVVATVVAQGGAKPAQETAAALTVPAAGPPFSFTVAGYKVGKLRVAPPIDVSTAYQISPVYADDMVTNDRAVDESEPSTDQGPTLYAYLTVYRPGAYEPGKLAKGTSVTIAGRPGLELGTLGKGTHVRTLAWQYDTDAWAVIDAYSSTGDNPTATQLRELAAGLRGAAPTPARVPVTVGHVPAGYELGEVSMHAITGLNGIASARDGDHAGLLFAKPALPTTGLTTPHGGVDGVDVPGTFTIYVVPARNANQSPSPGISCLRDFCNRWSADGATQMQVVSTGPRRLPEAELIKILNGLTLGDVSDDRTWTEVTAALP
ncbi:hypothetical protein GCM10009687_47360 [Asanoa iriomotensis]|uniref:Uncharacterized protein n=1 Tax=Asanoa iriomotensis TaxID=234613 RepID=A0ABQ4BYU1_9ACTN|nr:hypothetical protein Air01nite_13200 [Asanoa iriomotensis]